MAVSPNLTFLITAARVGLPQGFALLAAAESQSVVYARRSVGGLGRRLSARRGLDGVEFGPRAAELRAFHHQHRGQEQEAAGRVPAPHPRGHLRAGGEGPREGAEPRGAARARLADAVPRPCRPALGAQDPQNHAVSAGGREQAGPKRGRFSSRAGRLSGPWRRSEPGPVTAKEEEEEEAHRVSPPPDLRFSGLGGFSVRFPHTSGLSLGRTHVTSFQG